MAVRRWAVRPQANGVVDRDELVSALMDGEALQWRAGGVLTVMHQRTPTDLDGEMVTTAVIIEWKDRTDARDQPEQPGGTVPAAPPAAPAPQTPAPAPAPIGASPDGLDESTLPDEDLSEVTAPLA